MNDHDVNRTGALLCLRGAESLRRLPQGLNCWDCRTAVVGDLFFAEIAQIDCAKLINKLMGRLHVYFTFGLALYIARTLSNKRQLNAINAGWNQIANESQNSFG
jgi:hypothetical protein